MKLLEGKAVVITGSGRGIGAACAQGVARLGAAVVVNDIDRAEAEDTAAAITAAGGEAVVCVADISRWEEAGRLISSCVAAFGRIDGLVNNAGVYHRASIKEFDPTTARALVDANILGTLYCTGHAVKPMLEQGAGSIINVVSGAHLGVPGLGVYGATKGAVASMVYTWAIELAGSGIRVNALSPFGRTRMGLPPAGTPLDAEMQQRLADIQPPEANSPVVEYLLSDLSRHVNGQLVRIDGREVYLYTHPALLTPPAIRNEWTALTVADAFDIEFKDRLVQCGVLGMPTLPVKLDSGYWTRAGARN